MILTTVLAVVPTERFVILLAEFVSCNFCLPVCVMSLFAGARPHDVLLIREDPVRIDTDEGSPLSTTMTVSHEIL